jgi:hypothetical protein
MEDADVEEKFEKLKLLLAKGILTQEQYEKKKEDLVDMFLKEDKKKTSTAPKEKEQSKNKQENARQAGKSGTEILNHFKQAIAESERRDDDAQNTSGEASVLSPHTTQPTSQPMRPNPPTQSTPSTQPVPVSNPPNNAPVNATVTQKPQPVPEPAESKPTTQPTVTPVIVSPPIPVPTLPALPELTVPVPQSQASTMAASSGGGATQPLLNEQFVISEQIEGMTAFATAIPHKVLYNYQPSMLLYFLSFRFVSFRFVSFRFVSFRLA